MRVVNKNILRLYENNDLEQASESSQSNQIKSTLFDIRTIIIRYDIMIFI